jgi:hypothetical protein
VDFNLSNICVTQTYSSTQKNIVNNAPPDSLMDLITNPKVKTTKGGVGVRSLARGIWGGGGRGRGACWSSKMGTMKSDKQINYSHILAQPKMGVHLGVWGFIPSHFQEYEM